MSVLAQVACLTPNPSTKSTQAQRVELEVRNLRTPRYAARGAGPLAWARRCATQTCES